MFVFNLPANSCRICNMSAFEEQFSSRNNSLLLFSRIYIQRAIHHTNYFATFIRTQPSHYCISYVCLERERPSFPSSGHLVKRLSVDWMTLAVIVDIVGLMAIYTWKLVYIIIHNRTLRASFDVSYKQWTNAKRIQSGANFV